MATTFPNRPLAVCSWSLKPDSPQTLISLLQRIEVPRVQLALDPLRESPAVWGQVGEHLAAAHIKIVSGMFGTVGEDYTSLESIKRTGGLVPDQTWEQNWKNLQTTLTFAKKLRLNLLTFHAGFLPHQPSDPGFRKILGRMERVADLFGSQNIDLAFETGQESAETLRIFLEELGHKNVGVNFDPANMILYDKGDPIEALKTLGPWLKQCHIKDAVRTTTPGTWGEEVAVGAGQVNWKAFFHALRELGFTGPIAIEREAGDQRVQDIRTARHLVETLEGS